MFILIVEDGILLAFFQGTVWVPALCQYAHKLAFLVGQSIHAQPDRSLQINCNFCKMFWCFIINFFIFALIKSVIQFIMKHALSMLEDQNLPCMSVPLGDDFNMVDWLIYSGYKNWCIQWATLTHNKFIVNYMAGWGLVWIIGHYLWSIKSCYIKACGSRCWVGKLFTCHSLNLGLWRKFFFFGMGGKKSFHVS